MNKNLVIIGLVLAVLGVVFALLPHDLHMSLFGSGGSDHMGEEDHMTDMTELELMDGHAESSHMKWNHGNQGLFMTIGLVVAVIGIGFAIAGWQIFD